MCVHVSWTRRLSCYMLDLGFGDIWILLSITFHTFLTSTPIMVKVYIFWKEISKGIQKCYKSWLKILKHSTIEAKLVEWRGINVSFVSNLWHQDLTILHILNLATRNLLSHRLCTQWHLLLRHLLLLHSTPAWQGSIGWNFNNKWYATETFQLDSLQFQLSFDTDFVTWCTPWRPKSAFPKLR